MPRLAPEVVLPVYERLSGRRFWTEARRLRTLQWQDREVLQSRALQKVRDLLAHATANVPHYRDLLARSGLRPEDIRAVSDLATLPVLDKTAVRTGFTGALLAADLPVTRRCLVRTSGSTGFPLELYQDRGDLDAQWASFLLFQDWAGLALSDVRVAIAGRTLANPEAARWSRVPRWLRRRLLGQETRVIPGPDLTLPAFRELAARLPAGRRYHVVAYPSYAARLARQILDAGVELHAYPAAVVSGGESLLPGDAEAISRAFRCPVVNRYSAWEATFMAQTCPDHPGLLHVNTERVVVRVVREDGSPAAPGESGRVLVTNLTNRVMPLVNYDIGDRAVAGAPCPCGRGFPTLGGVDGRGPELIRTPAGAAISAATLCNFLTFSNPVVGHVSDFQAAQTSPGAVVLRVVPTPRFSATFATGLRDALQALLGPGIDVRVEAVDEIPRLPSGKRAVIVPLPGGPS